MWSLLSRAGRSRAMALAKEARPSVVSTLVDVLATPWRGLAFAVTAAAVTFLYTILLPFAFTQRFGLGNWRYLNGPSLAWSLILGMGMALVLMTQVHAAREVTAARSGALGGVAFVTSLLPSFLCCTPIIPTLLTFVGFSAVSVYGLTGGLQHFFATHETEFLVGSVALLLLSAWWSLRSIAGAACLAGACAAGAGTTGDPGREPIADPRGALAEREGWGP
jgi:hypothetical protein